MTSINASRTLNVGAFITSNGSSQHFLLSLNSISVYHAHTHTRIIHTHAHTHTRSYTHMHTRTRTHAHTCTNAHMLINTIIKTTSVCDVTQGDS